MVILKWMEPRNKNLVQKLVNTLPYSSKSIVIDGRRYPAKLSGRKVKELRRAASFHQVEWPEEMIPLKEKDREQYLLGLKKHGFIKPPKGVKEVRNGKQQERIFQIAEKLKGMSEKIEKMQNEEKNRKYKDVMDLKGFKK